MTVQKTEQYVQLIDITSNASALIERVARVCYKSWDNMTDNSNKAFIERLIKLKHFSMFEHAKATFFIKTNRAIANEITRHRMASYAQESTRYVGINKNDPFNVVTSLDLKDKNIENYFEHANQLYLYLINQGYKKQDAREVLPLNYETSLFLTANFRELRHMIELRTSKQAHPQIKELFEMIKTILIKEAPDFLWEKI